MAELAFGPYMPGFFMNDGGDRVVMEQQLIAAPEQQDIQGIDELEQMAAYEMLEPFMRVAGALMKNVGGMIGEARKAREDALEASVNSARGRTTQTKDMRWR